VLGNSRFNHVCNGDGPPDADNDGVNNHNNNDKDKNSTDNGNDKKGGDKDSNAEPGQPDGDKPYDDDDDDASGGSIWTGWQTFFAMLSSMFTQADLVTIAAILGVFGVIGSALWYRCWYPSSRRSGYTYIQ
jgi:hypothetical protein